MIPYIIFNELYNIYIYIYTLTNKMSSYLIHFGIVLKWPYYSLLVYQDTISERNRTEDTNAFKLCY